MASLVEDTTVALVLARFDAQDRQLEAVGKQLDTITREVRRTNGRVTTLETASAVSVKIADLDRARQTNSTASRRWWVSTVGMVVCVFAGGAAGDAGHALGWW